MQKIVECKLVVNSEINGKKDCTIVNGKGFFKKNDAELVVYFSNEEMKYKYIYNNNNLIVYCNDSCYEFNLNRNGQGKIKNGNYVFIITTKTSKIEVYKNLIVLEYELYQQDSIIGTYESELSF